MKRSAGFLLLFLAATTAVSAQYYFDYPKFARFEAGLYAFGWLPLNPGATAYADSWYDRLLISVYENTRISQTAAVGGGAGASFSLFFNRTVGIELLAEAATAKLTTTADMTAGWTWADRRMIRQEATWPGTGRLEMTRIALNLVNRFDNLVRTWSVSGGLAVHRPSFSADSWFGFGVSKMTEDGGSQLMDMLKVGLRIPKTSWWALGADLGFGWTHKLSDRIGLKLEIRGFFCPSRTLTWTFVQGLYDGVFYGQIVDEPFGEDSVAFVTRAETLSSFVVKPSSLRLGVGLTWASAPVVQY
jgi:hypothetical protein